MQQGSCQKCGGTHVLPGSGICVKCGFRNKPRVDLEEKERKAEEDRKRAEAEEQKRQQEARAKEREELLRLVQTALEGVSRGDMAGPAQLLRESKVRIEAFGDDQLNMQLLKLEAAFFKSQGLNAKYLEVLKELVPRLPFAEEHFEHHYALGTAYQEKGNQAAAHKVFERFVNAFVTDYRDVRERYSQTAGARGGLQSLDGQIRVRAGAFDREAELIRKWIDAACSANRYFSEGVLLADDREHIVEIEDLPATGTVDLDLVLKHVRGQLKGPLGRLSASREALALYRGDSEKGSPVDCILFSGRADSPGMKHGAAGELRIAARLVGVDRVKIVLYVFFQPHAPEEVEDVSPRDFNAAVQAAVQAMHPVEGDQEIVTLVETIKRVLNEAVRRELALMNRGAAVF